MPSPDNAVCHQKCGRIFCQGCLEMSLSKNKLCPYCREEILQMPGLVKNESHFIYSYMAEMIVRCPILECGWKGERVELEKHKENCVYRIVDCTFGCGRKMRVSEFYKHSRECELARRYCKKCDKTYTFVEFMGHKCNERKNVKMCCPFKFIGCKWINKHTF